MNCLTLLLALLFCEPSETYLTSQYVDNSVGLYFREFVLKGHEIVTIWQVKSDDLKDDAVEVVGTPFMVRIDRHNYMPACREAECWLTPY